MTLANLNYQWEWEGDKGVWQQYPLNIQEEISQAYNAGNSEVMNDGSSIVKMICLFQGLDQSNG